MHPLDELRQLETRRQFFTRGKNVLGYAALAKLLGDRLPVIGESQPASPIPAGHPAAMLAPHFAPKAKRVIYLHMVGGPAQMDTYDYKPGMGQWYDKDLPESIRNGQRLTTMTSGQSRFPIAPSKFKFARHGQSGMWVTELLPWTAK
jgi:hypothetical protein